MTDTKDLPLFPPVFVSSQSEGQMRYERNIPHMGEREFPRSDFERFTSACKDITESYEEMADGDQWLDLALKGFKGHPKYDEIFFAIEHIRGTIEGARGEIYSLMQLLVDLGVARMR